MSRSAKRIPLLAALLICCTLLLACSAGAETSQRIPTNPNRKTVRVGFPIQNKLTDKTPEGEYTGYNVDYLQEVVKYTNWEIEYVEAEGDLNTQLNTLSDMLDAGEIDMLGTMLVNDYLRELYLYPTYSYGSSYTALVVMEDSRYWLNDSFSAWNGIKVATYPGLERRMALLEQFAHVSGFTYERVECETLADVVAAVQDGRADACLQVDINIEDGMRAIARFSPSPYYFALNKGREDLLIELNAAMLNLLESYPSLQGELYSRYFLHKGSFHLSDSDRAWVESLAPMRVLYFAGSSPIQDVEHGVPCGVAAQFMQSLCEATGLKTVPVFASSYAEGAAMVERGEVDIIAAMSSNSSLNEYFNVRLSTPYFQSYSARVLRRDAVNPAIPPYVSINAENAIQQLKLHPNTAAVIDAYCASYYMRKQTIYDHLHIEQISRSILLYSVGALPSVDQRLTGIISAYSSSLSEQAKQNMLYTASQQPLRYSFWEWTEIYRWQIFALFVALTAVLILLRWRQHNRLVHENAKEAERLYQFSCMVNECLIRYDVSQDRLIMQNSKIMFANREVLSPFLKADSEALAQDENELQCVNLLKSMILSHNASSDLSLEVNGVTRWYRIDLVYISNDHAVGRMYSIEDEMEQRAMLEHKAEHDPLTGLLNRSAIERFLNEHLPDSREGAFLLLDLDNFKQVNDTMGHLEGDKVLKRFAACLEAGFREDDLKVRLGGDEFVVFLPTNVSQAELGERLSRFMGVAATEVFADYADCRLSVSIGVAYVAEDAMRLEELYSKADKALYIAKAGGKNRYFICGNANEPRSACTAHRSNA